MSSSKPKCVQMKSIELCPLGCMCRADTLFITTAACRLTPAERAAQPEAGFVFAAQVGATGRPTDLFAG